ncbi:hypothetical protein HPB49_016249 [Dermacentor silvarum]|uniref:Uncharacterized protein n=1 Tax=Dermacentor silvarum TaxID=543639 RepID=A0ACB8DJR4_DERSI|nr:hypothetical protein HPB49_016249 [Dermacentor silvarum]
MSIRDESGAERIIFAIIGICLFVSLIGFVGYLLLGSEDVEDVEEADIFGGSGGGGGGGGGGGSPPSVVPPTTPSPAVSVDEIVCTIGDYALFPSMIPRDGLCNYVYYTNVVVVKDKLNGVAVSQSWEMFEKEMRTLTRTSGGIGFDIRYTNADSVNSEVEKKLRELVPKNIKHYGVLNVLQRANKVNDLYNKAKGLLSKLKRVQGNDAQRKTLIALGIYNYREQNAYGILQNMFTDAVNNHVADTVIAYSSVGWIERDLECYSHPPAIFNRGSYQGAAAAESERAPEMRRIALMMTRDKQFTSNTKMGLSFELGTLVYQLKTPYAGQSPSFEMANAPCTTLYVTSLEVVCAKLAENATFLRPDMSLLMVNAHLGDPTQSCVGLDGRERGDLFWRIEAVKTALHVP